MPTYSADLTSPTGTFSASSGTAANAFNNVMTTSQNGWVPTAGSFPAWIQYTFPSAERIAKVRIWSFYESGYEAIKDFSIQASATGTFTGEQVTLYTGVHPNETTNGFVDYTFSNSGTYRYYRIYVTSVYPGNGNGNISITEIEMMADLTVMRYLFEDGTDIKKWDTGTSAWVVVGTSPVTETMFTSSGMTGLASINNANLQTLASQTPKLLFYSDETAVLNRTINKTAIPPNKLISPVGDINISNVINIDSVTLTATATGAGMVKVIVSFDRGFTWHSWNGTAWMEISPTANDVTANGMSIATVNGIPSADWMGLRGGSDTIRFAYLLGIETTGDLAQTDTLQMQVDMEGTWDHYKDADVSFTSNTLVSVTVYSDGDYKINY